MSRPGRPSRRGASVAVTALALALAATGCGAGAGWEPAPEALPDAPALQVSPVTSTPEDRGGPSLTSVDRVVLFSAGDDLGVIGSGRYADLVRTWRTDGRTWTTVGDVTGPIQNASRTADGRLCGTRRDDAPICIAADGRTVRTLDRPPAHPDHPQSSLDGRDPAEGRRWSATMTVGDDFYALVESRRLGYLVRLDGRRQRPVGDGIVVGYGSHIVLAPREGRAPCVVGSSKVRDAADEVVPDQLELTVACPGERTRKVIAPLPVPAESDVEEHLLGVDRELEGAVIVGRTVVAGIKHAWDAGTADDRHAAGTTWTVVAGDGSRLEPVPVGGSVGDGTVGGDLHVAGGRVWALRRASGRGAGFRTGSIDLLRIDADAGRVDGRATLVEDGRIERSPGAVRTVGDRLWVAAQAAGPVPGQDDDTAVGGRIGWRLWTVPSAAR